MSDVKGFVSSVLNSLFLCFFLIEVILIVTDLLSLVLIRNTIGKRVKKQIKIRDFWKIFGFTNFTYIIVILILSYIETATTGGGDYYPLTIPLITVVLAIGTPAKDFISELTTVIFISMLPNIVFNFFVVFRKDSFSKIRRLICSVIVSILTAPYLFYFPVGQLFLQ